MRAKKYANAEQSSWWANLDAKRKEEDIRKDNKKLQFERQVDMVIAAFSKGNSAGKQLSSSERLSNEIHRAHELQSLLKDYDAIKASITEITAATPYKELEAAKAELAQYSSMLKENKSEQRRLLLLQTTFTGPFASKKIAQTNNELSIIGNRIAQLYAACESCASKVSSLFRPVHQANEKINDLQKRLMGYSNKEQLRAVISEINHTISELQKEQNKQDGETTEYSFNEALELIQTNMRILVLAMKRNKSFLSMCNASGVSPSIFFGKYPQKTATQLAPIEWKIIEQRYNQVLLLSKYGLDCQPYCTSEDNDNWQNSSIRYWLNNDFYRTAFTNKEQANIITTKVSACINPQYRVSQANYTEDKVYLLSSTEFKNYYTTKESRRCIATEYATSQGAYIVESSYSLCWLRSHGGSRNSIERIYYDGSIGESPTNANGLSIRPAIWLSLDNLL